MASVAAINAEQSLDSSQDSLLSPRPDRRQRNQMDRVIRALSEGRTVADACKHAKVRMATMYRWHTVFPEFALAWDRARFKAQSIQADHLEDRLYEYGKGYEVREITTDSKGRKTIKTKREHDTRAAVRYLEANRSHKYAPQVHHKHAHLHVDATELSRDQLEAIAAKALGK